MLYNLRGGVFSCITYSENLYQLRYLNTFFQHKLIYFRVGLVCLKSQFTSP